MAKIYVTELAFISPDAPAAKLPPMATQTLTSTGSSQQSAAFNAETRYVRVHTDGIISVLCGVNPTVTTNDTRIPANGTEYFSVTPGHKLAYITNT